MICSSEFIKLVRRSILIPQRTTRRKEPRPAFDYLQLAHVNHQIRQEFVPICYTKIKLDTHFNDISLFARTFLLPHTAHTNTASVTIDISGITRYNSQKINVYSLLQFFRKCPDATFEIVSKGQNKGVSVNTLRTLL